MVFQNYALFPHMTVRRNVGFGLKMRGRPPAEIAEKVEAALALVRLQGQGDKLPGQLSGGQQQRVAIARAVVIEPPLVLMDEPLSNLDAKLRLEMRAEIRRIHNQMKATTIYVTHDQEEALSLADRIVVLRDGGIRQVGTPHELYQQPAHLDVAEFVGFRSRLSGRIVARDGDKARLSVGANELAGRLVADLEVGAAATLAVRPDDVGVTEGPGIPAMVDAMEYRGREYVGVAHTADGAELIFHADQPSEPGNPVTLAIDPARALVFSA